MLKAALNDISNQRFHAQVYLLKVYPARGLPELMTGSSTGDFKEDSNRDFYQTGQK